MVIEFTRGQFNLAYTLEGYRLQQQQQQQQQAKPIMLLSSVTSINKNKNINQITKGQENLKHPRDRCRHAHLLAKLKFLFL